eukprot:Partr_v1_DN24610_c0_g1_i1_m59915 putative Thiol methyltransferase
MTSTNTPSERTIKIQATIAAKGHGASGWDSLWKDGITPWNIGQPAPPMLELIEQGVILNGKNLRTLVPGCGEGYDVLYLASLPQVASSMGLDISETAVEAIKTNSSANAKPEHHAKLSIVLDDFFTWNYGEKFDFVLDYTFFCAINPEMRQKWAERQAEIIKPSGQLLTIIFPLGDFENGPPFAVSVDAYKKLLLGNFKLVQEPYVSRRTVSVRAEREMVAVWTRL